MRYALPDEAQAARDEGLIITYEITDFETGELINISKDTCDVILESGKLYKAKKGEFSYDADSGTINFSGNLDGSYTIE